MYFLLIIFKDKFYYLKINSNIEEIEKYLLCRRNQCCESFKDVEEKKSMLKNFKNLMSVNY